MTFDQVGFAAPAPSPVTAGEIKPVHDSIERRLTELLAMSPAVPTSLRDAVRHAALAPGKRVRSHLLYLIADPAPSQAEAVLALGCAVEMVHTASLILDDLPCMDDARTRRQRPATHVVFGQSTALLGAISLLTRSFEVISGLNTLPPAMRCRLTEVLSGAVGWDGLSAGQEQDLNGRASDAAQLETLNRLKTGVLFIAAAEMGAIARGLDDRRIAAVRRFASHLGQAFQVADDLIDAMSTVAEAGKDVGQDKDKATFVTLYGIRRARELYTTQLDAADRALNDSGIDPEPVRQLIGRLSRNIDVRTADPEPQ